MRALERWKCVWGFQFFNLTVYVHTLAIIVESAHHLALGRGLANRLVVRGCAPGGGCMAIPAAIEKN